MNFLTAVSGKIATGLVALAIIAAGISWWQSDPSTRQIILSISGRLVGWFVVVLLLPWLLFWLIGMVARMQNNIAGAVLVLVITAIETVMLAWLFHFSIAGSGRWMMFVAGSFVAGVYNLFSCDWIAEKVE